MISMSQETGDQAPQGSHEPDKGTVMNVICLQVSVRTGAGPLDVFLFVLFEHVSVRALLGSRGPGQSALDPDIWDQRPAAPEYSA